MTYVLDRFQRVRKGRPCPVCHKIDWCLVELGTGGEPVAAVCPRVISARPWGQAGYLHDLRAGQPRHRASRGPLTIEPQRRFDAIADDLYRRADAAMIHATASDLGVAEHALVRLRIGVARGNDLARLGLRGCDHAVTFPMTNHRGHVIGVRVRLAGGGKLCVKGSTVGLFVPRNLVGTGTVYIAEGESDTAALLTMGVEAFGRPGALLCQTLCAKLARACSMTDVVIVADGDRVGEAGAQRLAASLRLLVPRVRVVVPPAKDVRAWLGQGATRADLEALPASESPAARPATGGAA